MFSDVNHFTMSIDKVIFFKLLYEDVFHLALRSPSEASALNGCNLIPITFRCTLIRLTKANLLYPLPNLTASFD